MCCEFRMDTRLWAPMDQETMKSFEKSPQEPTWNRPALLLPPPLPRTKILLWLLEKLSTSLLVLFLPSMPVFFFFFSSDRFPPFVSRCASPRRSRCCRSSRENWTHWRKTSHGNHPMVFDVLSLVVLCLFPNEMIASSCSLRETGSYFGSTTSWTIHSPYRMRYCQRGNGLFALSLFSILLTLLVLFVPCCAAA